MDKLKRIFALVGAVLLVLLYVITFILSFMSSPASKDWLTASIAATVIIPVFLYAYILIVRVMKNHAQESRMHEEMFMQKIKEQMKQKEEAEAEMTPSEQTSGMPEKQEEDTENENSGL